MAKTLIDFRAEKGLYLKDVATALEMSEDELRAVEKSGALPEELGQRIISHYALPADYFAEPMKQEKVKIITVKKTPAKPVNYFFGVSLVWGLITGAIAAIPSYISMIATTLFSSAIAGMGVFEILASTPFTLFSNYFPTIITIFSGIFLAKYILNNTTYTGDIKKYQFLYPILPDATLLFLSMITGLVYELIMSKILDGSLDASSPSYLLTAMSGAGFSFVVSVVVMLVSAFVCAKLLDAAITEDEVKKSKFLRTLAIIVTASVVVNTVVYVIRSITAEDFHLVQMLQNILGYVLTVVLAWAVALVKTENKKLELAVYTILPIVAIIL